MPEVTPGEVPFSEAIDFFKAKVNLPSKSWDEMVGAINAKGFTVAGATKMALLEDLRGAVNAAIESGETINEFRDRFDAIVQQHGWAYKGSRGWRTRVIYDTNLRTARMAGRWEQYQRVKDRRPYLQYQTAGDARVRPEHAAWDDWVLPIDSPWWDTHYPPNGWGCRCTTRSLSQRQLEREGKAVTPEPTVERAERVNPDTGEVFPPTPEGIDTGWDYNVGKAWLGPDLALAERVANLPKPWRDQALRQAADVVRRSAPSFGLWAERVIADPTSRGQMRTAGWLSPKIIDGLARAGQDVNTPLIVARDIELRAAASAPWAQALPTYIADPQAVLLDRRSSRGGSPALLYVLDASTDALAVARVELRGQAGSFHLILPSDTVSPATLRDRGRYRLLQGSL
jgi:SPP1 gp7 family putative phage head morphogenesis protein